MLRAMAEGKNNAGIASSLYLTEHSAGKVIHSIGQGHAPRRYGSQPRGHISSTTRCMVVATSVACASVGSNALWRSTTRTLPRGRPWRQPAGCSWSAPRSTTVPPALRRGPPRPMRPDSLAGSARPTPSSETVRSRCPSFRRTRTSARKARACRSRPAPWRWRSRWRRSRSHALLRARPARAPSARHRCRTTRPARSRARGAGSTTGSPRSRRVPSQAVRRRPRAPRSGWRTR